MSMARCSKDASTNPSKRPTQRDQDDPALEAIAKAS
jgi:hypothetical protein